MVEFPKLPQQKLLQRLEHPQRKVRMVLDTDTYNEIDDQFAVIYALKSPESVTVEAFYAAPFFNDLSEGPKDGMEKSYNELLKIRAIMPEMTDIPIYRGSEGYLAEAGVPQESAAARNLVERAMASSEDDPLYVVAIGAITNVASALLMEPRIIEKIVVVWLGGHALHWPDTTEFNLAQDLHASRTVLNSGVPLILVPCAGVASHLATTLSEVEDYVRDKGPIGQYLYETYRDCSKDHFGYSRVIWDISTIAYLVDPSWIPSTLVHSPLLSEDFRWSVDHSRHFIRCAHYAHRDSVFKDLFRKLGE
ncbi:nucleoside hydrolase [Paenibacillus lignilyticus]|uniref:Nucleoside hydrolase n=1 Tax=Paenibacillus lignilyticus TaxID=1172615 RepID=A0ABS5CKM4_9BACL|nr:nucleoside hydrolase [Paenibacillus lignilyticus]MBP3966420.1 nucleoside hydrolase [Paenibacillus lignilyticus]